jgi:Flp pilus assembly protein TadG
MSFRKDERGSVTIMTAILLFGLVLVLGLAIDISRIYMVRAGLQNAADAAALAAARELNSGSSGLTDAVAQAQAIVNSFGFNRTGLTAPTASIVTVEFAASLSGPWYVGAAGVPAGSEGTIEYVRVTTQTANVNILFAARVLGSSHVEQRQAVAGMSVNLNRICNFFPIALALTPATWATLQAAAPGTASQLTGTYTDGITGSTASVVEYGYAVIEIECDDFGTPCPYPVSGTGAVETVSLAAGIPGLCASIGDEKTLDSSQSANSNNGRDALARGTNTRLNIYSPGPGSLNATTYPPDSNVTLGITATEYLAKSPLTAPSNPGQDDRRVLVMPIIEPIPPGGSPTVTIVDFGAFVLRNTVEEGTSCGPSTWCGADLQLEYLGKDFPIGRGFFTPDCGATVNTTTLTKAVLYR